MATPFTTRNTPLGVTYGGTQTELLPDGFPVLLTDLVQVPAKASSALLQVVALGSGNLPVLWRLDGDDTQTTGLVLGAGDAVVLSNKQQLQSAVLYAAESGVMVSVQFFSTLVQP